MNAPAETDLYEVLQIPRTATRPEIKKAFHKAALSSHPDKVAAADRADAEARFKTQQRAYEILADDNSRAAYDAHGMAAFEKGGGGGANGSGGPDLEDILARMFAGGGGFEGVHGGFGGGASTGGARRRGKGRDEWQEYEVTLEELYRGKTARFASTKKVVCAACKGGGGRERAKSKTCGTCGGSGQTTHLRPLGSGLVTQEHLPCTTCHARGTFFAERDKCKKCKGARVMSVRKMLELSIPRGSRAGETIVLPGEADQQPDDAAPGDIVFEIVETPHAVFARARADLRARLQVTLAEALTGLRRTVCVHLDGRAVGLHVAQPRGRVLRPGQVLRVVGEGMPVKRSDSKGDLYLVVEIVFPEDGWLRDQAAVDGLRRLLPPPQPPVQGNAESNRPGTTTLEDVEEVEFEAVEGLEGFGADSGAPGGGAEWEDEDEELDPAQCATQ